MPRTFVEQRVHGPVDHQAHAHGRGEVDAGVDVLEQPEDEVLVEDRALDELDPARAQQVLDVRDAPGAEIVEHEDFMAVRRKTVG